MAVELDTSAFRRAAAVMDIVREEAESVLANRTQALRDFMASQWPNQSNSGPHADGDSSEATGASSGAMVVEPVLGSTIGMEWGFGDATNPETGESVDDYYEHVHFTGASSGSALESARTRFYREVDAIRDDIITAALARLGG